MKYGIIITLLCIFIITSCKKNTELFEIDIKCSQANNLTVRIFSETETGLKLEDSSKIEMSRAKLSGKVLKPELMYIFIDNFNDYLPIFVENSNISIVLNNSKISKSSVKGSESHKIFTDFVQSYTAYCDKAAGIKKTLSNAEKNYDTLMMKSMEESYSVLKSELIDFQVRFVEKYIYSPVACYIISSHLMYGLSKENLQKLLEEIPNSNKDNKYYFTAKNYLMQLKNENEKDTLITSDNILDQVSDTLWANSRG